MGHTVADVAFEREAQAQSRLYTPMFSAESPRGTVQPETVAGDGYAVQMDTTTKERTNQEWLADLRGPTQHVALEDLRQVLLKGLGYAFPNGGKVSADDLDDFSQEALLRILASLDTFRGESRFTSWARKIAVRVAFTELRRKRWKDVSLDELTASNSAGEFVQRFMADPSAGPERQAAQRSLLEQMERIMREELTDRQLHALVAVGIHGMPVEETARRMGTNRNALYKLMHDARKRIKNRMLLEGFSAQEMLSLF